MNQVRGILYLTFYVVTLLAVGMFPSTANAFKNSEFGFGFSWNDGVSSSAGGGVVGGYLVVTSNQVLYADSSSNSRSRKVVHLPSRGGYGCAINLISGPTTTWTSRNCVKVSRISSNSYDIELHEYNTFPAGLQQNTASFNFSFNSDSCIVDVRSAGRDYINNPGIFYPMINITSEHCTRAN